MDKNRKKSVTLIGGLIVGVFILFALKAAFTNSTPKGFTVFSTDSSTGEPVLVDGVQEVTLTLGNDLDYQPNPIRVKAGIPVRITVDLNSVRGCTSSVVMPAFGIRKRAVPGDNIIEFTPEKPGTYPFSCAMGMSHGVVVVE